MHENGLVGHGNEWFSKKINPKPSTYKTHSHSHSYREQADRDQLFQNPTWNEHLTIIAATEIDSNYTGTISHVFAFG